MLLAKTKVPFLVRRGKAMVRMELLKKKHVTGNKNSTWLNEVL